MKLHLHVKTEYFLAIKDGSKTHEYRLANAYWMKRIGGRHYDGVVIYNAYRPGPENRMEFRWRHPQIITRQHPHFGPDPVQVYAIDVTEQVTQC